MLNEFAAGLDYLDCLDRADGFKRLKSKLTEIEAARGLPPNRVYYLSIPPEAVGECVQRLAENGLIAPVRLPTTPGQLQATEATVEDVVKKVDKMPLKEIGDNLRTALGDLDLTLVSARGTLVSARGTLDNASDLTRPTLRRFSSLAICSRR
jgi:hypothetical protein